MNEYRNIDIAQCEALRMHKLNTQIPDDLEILQNDSLIKAGCVEAKRAAAFITYRMEASYSITVDETLLSTKTEAKAVLLALEVVSYKYKLILNTDSQAVVLTAQTWLSKDSPLSIRN
ncbi:hypothetical protein G9A89_012100 [Geosiphon pyriformis]|nr:hypothetical protein G9A89_012100 [Geosiphon pyriformis]